MKQTRRLAFAPSNGCVATTGGAAAHVLISGWRRQQAMARIEGFLMTHSGILEFNIVGVPINCSSPHGQMEVTLSEGHKVCVSIQGRHPSKCTSVMDRRRSKDTSNATFSVHCEATWRISVYQNALGFFFSSCIFKDGSLLSKHQQLLEAQQLNVST